MWTVIGIGVVLALLGLDLLVGTLRSRGGTDMLGMAGANLTPGIGSCVNLAAAAAVTVATAFKGREAKLF